MGASSSAAHEESKKNEDAPMFPDIHEYQICKLPMLLESLETWKSIFSSRRLVNFREFDDIFGHILGDPDWHFAVFTGDDVKRRVRAKTMALAELRKKGMLGKNGPGSVNNGQPQGRKRSGSLFRSSIAGSDVRSYQSNMNDSLSSARMAAR